MAAQRLSAKVISQEADPQVVQLVVGETGIGAMVGVTERGPFEATLVNSPGEFRRIYGGYTANADGALAVDGFFGEGGRKLYVKRVVHYTDIHNAATKTSAASTITLATAAIAATAGSVTGSAVEPFNLEPNDTLVGQVDGNGSQTATFTATAAAVECANAETYVLTDGMTLTVKIDAEAVAQTITFLTAEFVSIGAATAEEVAAVINAKIVGAKATVTTGGTKVTITSDTRGTASHVEVTGGTANAVLGFSTTEVDGTGNVANIDAVTVAEVKTVVEAAWTNGLGVTVSNVGGAVKITSDTTGASSSVLVVASSTADDELGLDNATHSGTASGTFNTLKVDGKTDGTYGNSLKIKIAAATSGASDEFDLQVLNSDNQVLETWPNLSMTDGDDNYCETVINDVNTGSDLIQVADLDAATSSPNDLPATGTSALMTGGNDGLSGLVDTDFTGSATSKTGVYGFDKVTDQCLLFAANRTTATVANALLAYCQDVKKNFWFSILGSPANQSASQIVTYAGTLTISDRGALYWPRLKIDNPSTSIFGTAKTVTVDNAGWVAGVWSRVHNARLGGVYDAPAGELGQFRTVKGYDNEDCLEESKRDIVYPKRVNPMNNEFGLNIDGSYTLKAASNWPTVAGRVGTDFIMKTVDDGLKIAKHKSINTTLMGRVRRTVKRFLDEQLPLGAFKSKDPTLSFYVKVEEVTSDADQDAGILNIEYGLNRATEAQWVIATVRKFVPTA
jgi:hypothetical protein